ncbi:MAG: flippase [Saprospiraceae bacterium]
MNNYWVRSGLLTLLEKGSGLVFALGTAVMLLRGLTKADFAAWGVFLIFTYFLEMGRSGLIQNGLVRFLSTQKDNSAVYARITTASLALNFLFSIVSNFLLWLGLDWICQHYQVPQLVAVLPVYFITNFVMAVFYHCNFVQQANFEFRGIFWSTFFFRGSLFAWVLFCWLTGAEIQLPHLAWAMLAGAFLGTMASWFFARPFLNHAKTIDFQWVGRLVGFGKYVLGTNLSTMFYKNIDKLTLGSLLGPAAFAVYDAAGKITQLVEVPSFSIAAVVFPQSAARMETEGKAGVKSLYERSVAAILALILPFVVLVLLFAEPIVWLFAGEQYMDSAGVLRLTAFFGLFMPFAVQFGTILDSTGRPATNFLYTFFTAFLNLGLSYLFIQKFGLFGAAFATLAGYSVSFVLMQRLLHKDFGINALNVFRHIPDFYITGFNLVRKKLAPIG